MPLFITTFSSVEYVFSEVVCMCVSPTGVAKEGQKKVLEHYGVLEEEQDVLNHMTERLF